MKRNGKKQPGEGLEIPGNPSHFDLPKSPEDVQLIQNPDPSRFYPWGSFKDDNRLNFQNTEIKRTSTPGCFPGGMSPYGVQRTW